MAWQREVRHLHHPADSSQELENGLARWLSPFSGWSQLEVGPASVQRVFFEEVHLQHRGL